jgi:hypothetical protein
MGDGTVKYGPSITHTYRVANPDAIATVFVKDSMGREGRANLILNLRP